MLSTISARNTGYTREREIPLRSHMEGGQDTEVIAPRPFWRQRNFFLCTYRVSVSLPWFKRVVLMMVVMTTMVLPSWFPGYGIWVPLLSLLDLSPFPMPPKPT